ncbi:hypothetical protein AVEN_185708-1 [Araneus ventricosus]|uniref:Uncharacterized protein n=1 Tax=Araneus ventricosus TaxID=182803 RepID=A0A4Y2JFA0_ARAVE|nr:hypothetical protein AVEN_185708-1 [Araneus ventricosus]
MLISWDRLEVRESLESLFGVRRRAVVCSVLNDWNGFGVSSASKLSAIESAVIVVTSDLPTVCVAKSQDAELLLPVNCCLFTLLICERSIVSCTCAMCFSAHL